MLINNISDYAFKRKYVVFRMVNGEAWYYAAWDNYDKALNQALEEGGQVAPISEVKKGAK